MPATVKGGTASCPLPATVEGRTVWCALAATVKGRAPRNLNWPWWGAGRCGAAPFSSPCCPRRRAGQVERRSRLTAPTGDLQSRRRGRGGAAPWRRRRGTRLFRGGSNSTGGERHPSGSSALGPGVLTPAPSYEQGGTGPSRAAAPAPWPRPEGRHCPSCRRQSPAGGRGSGAPAPSAAAELFRHTHGTRGPAGECGGTGLSRCGRRWERGTAGAGTRSEKFAGGRARCVGLASPAPGQGGAAQPGCPRSSACVPVPLSACRPGWAQTPTGASSKTSGGRGDPLALVRETLQEKSPAFPPSARLSVNWQ